MSNALPSALFTVRHFVFVVVITGSSTTAASVFNWGNRDRSCPLHSTISTRDHFFVFCFFGLIVCIYGQKTRWASRFFSTWKLTSTMLNITRYNNIPTERITQIQIFPLLPTNCQLRPPNWWWNLGESFKSFSLCIPFKSQYAFFCFFKAKKRRFIFSFSIVIDVYVIKLYVHNSNFGSGVRYIDKHKCVFALLLLLLHYNDGLVSGTQRAQIYGHFENNELVTSLIIFQVFCCMGENSSFSFWPKRLGQLASAYRFST